MVIYPNHDTSLIGSSLPLSPHQKEHTEVLSIQTHRDSQSAEFSHMDRSCKFPNRKCDSSSLNKYLPKLQTKNNSRREGKRSHHINFNCSVEVPSNNIQLPGISVRRKDSGTDSVISGSNTNSTSSWPWEISDSESESFISLEDGKILYKSSRHGLKRDNPDVVSPCVPRPPASPPPPRSGKGAGVNAFGKKRNFRRSHHFELTLQNIEEVKDIENDLVKQSGSTGEISEVEEKKKNIGISHSRNYSTPVNFRELRKKIEATRVVSMGEMSSEFTKNYLTQQDKESEDMLRERCINWLKSLNPPPS